MNEIQLLEKVKQQESIIIELEKDIQSKKQWISLIAHDFIGISRNILWVLEALQSREITQEVLAELLPELKSNALINHRTIESTLAWINTQHKTFSPQKNEINGFKLFCSVRQSLENELKKKSIDLDFEGDQAVTFISDEIIITFILKRIVENAIKYSYVGGIIRFKCEFVNNENIIFTAEDFGVGMSTRAIERIFTLNEVNHTGTMNEKGAGISLGIIKDLLKLINASIKITSTENSGTKVTIELPRSLV